MSLLAGLISGSRWANVLLRWTSKAFQCSDMFWLCILIRLCPSYNITDRTSSCPVWAADPTLLSPERAQTPEAQSVRVVLTMHCAIACSGLPSSPISIADRFGEGQVSLKDCRIWFICEVSCFMEFSLCFPHNLCWHHILYGLCVPNLSLDLLSEGLTDIRMTLLRQSYDLSGSVPFFWLWLE